MNIIKFTAHDSHEKLFVQTLRNNVNAYFNKNQLSSKANVAMVIKTIVMLNLYLVPYALILSIPMSAFIALLLTVVMGIGVAGVGMGVMHDACHGSYSKRQWVNKWLSGTLYLL